MTPPLAFGFPPVIDRGASMLILGSFPSAQSLATGQYYANPRNAFWPITGRLFGFDPASPYAARLSALRAHGVALWDVLHACRRAGSADAAIKREGLQANDFAELFASYPAIDRVYFNGAKAEQLYRRHAVVSERVRYTRLPSTSPAHAVRPGAKLAAWGAAIASAA
ncbi:MULTISPECIES: DNA-deoxyinosine glycosylase [unclassified Mycobacterium]|uniref:DNA-deoxyinosine glycosylase n=1 Tax=unclassified Mycobacterium TaxID=2642494 RepID=UPI000800D2BF|nr:MULTISPECIES: DNA-deoxyinosine glycosylase [unclassified Mycobacterium]OBG78872.1 DNA-deoxyinosine glycosylase [Mycobacterium sp. E1214]OBH28338.1 DNA-deoxyinosine glycosylase [Mycobacterium sp. E1319]